MVSASLFKSQALSSYKFGKFSGFGFCWFFSVKASGCWDFNSHEFCNINVLARGSMCKETVCSWTPRNLIISVKIHGGINRKGGDKCFLDVTCLSWKSMWADDSYLKALWQWSYAKKYQNPTMHQKWDPSDFIFKCIRETLTMHWPFPNFTYWNSHLWST